jgi:phosphoglycolate phosphatase
MSLTPGSLDGATVALDLDGTLVDSAPDLVGALNTVLTEQGLPNLTVAEAGVMVGRGARALLERGFAAAGHALVPGETRPLVTRFIEVYRGRIARESRPFDGCESALADLKEAGASLCVCTNKFTDLSVALLESVGLAGYFAAIVGPDAAPAAKPDARHLIAAVEAAGGRIERCVMVGDSISDVGVARAAGAPSIVVTFGYTDVSPAELGGDYLIDRFAELPPLAGALLGRE